jgi:hypothetical protein
VGRLGWQAGLALCLLFGAAPAWSAGEVRTFQGKIVAINETASPPIIVVESRVGKEDSFIVGAAVRPSTDISRGSKKVALNTLKVGETVIISFTKSEQGHEARSIHAR